MPNTCLRVTDERYNRVMPVGGVLSSVAGGDDFLGRVTACYKLLAETVTVCNNECDEGRQEVCANGRDVYWLRCPVLGIDCAQGQKVMPKIRAHAFSVLRNIIPKKHHRSLAAPDEKPALLKAGRWDFDGVLYLSGKTGIGKSFCAAWLLYNRKIKHCVKHWDNENNWGGASGIAWLSAYSAVDKANFEWAQKVPLLVIDDLGTEVRTPANKATVAEIISRRYDNDVSTIITSNYGLLSATEPGGATCAGLYGERVVDRIIQSGREIKFDGPSMRVSAA